MADTDADAAATKLNEVASTERIWLTGLRASVSQLLGHRSRPPVHVISKYQYAYMNDSFTQGQIPNLLTTRC